ncbi:hypothetical protein OESDEN_22299 [Oesophagostomum dentatum]|uniref:Uncharacterized protein n=1 Tax=Oesophagostomum dentatum TaxID=61180 RepID=A0A0B1S2H5_OESDE|nr:hypothetical protein OESDEN_22299 [Oesophagostomum dentatum]
MRECGWTSKRFTQEIVRSKKRSQKIRNASRKLTDFFPTVRRLTTYSSNCDVDAQKHSRREWAALQRLRINAKLYDKNETVIEEPQICVPANGARRRGTKRYNLILWIQDVPKRAVSNNSNRFFLITCHSSFA